MSEIEKLKERVSELENRLENVSELLNELIRSYNGHFHRDSGASPITPKARIETKPKIRW
jgi:hypothetical protein